MRVLVFLGLGLLALGLPGTADEIDPTANADPSNNPDQPDPDAPVNPDDVHIDPQYASINCTDYDDDTMYTNSTCEQYDKTACRYECTGTCQDLCGYGEQSCDTHFGAICAMEKLSNLPDVCAMVSLWNLAAIQSARSGSVAYYYSYSYDAAAAQDPSYPNGAASAEGPASYSYSAAPYWHSYGTDDDAAALSYSYGDPSSAAEDTDDSHHTHHSSHHSHSSHSGHRNHHSSRSHSHHSRSSRRLLNNVDSPPPFTTDAFLEETAHLNCDHHSFCGVCRDNDYCTFALDDAAAILYGDEASGAGPLALRLLSNITAVCRLAEEHFSDNFYARAEVVTRAGPPSQLESLVLTEQTHIYLAPIGLIAVVAGVLVARRRRSGFTYEAVPDTDYDAI